MSDLQYLSDPRDQALCGLTPTIMAPRYGDLPSPLHGVHRYIIAANGLFLQAHTRALEVCIKVADTPALPYGPMNEYVRMARGKVPYSLYEQMCTRATKTSPQEWAGVVVFDPSTNEYRLTEPTVESAGPGHVTYRTGDYDDDCLLLDVHSHGIGVPYFSATDDLSDQRGIYISTVLGHCQTIGSITSVSRVVVNGQFFPVSWVPWEKPVNCGTGRM